MIQPDKDTGLRGMFCRKPISDPDFENDTEVVIGDEMIDKQNQKLSFEWKRPFDIQMGSGLTFVGNYDFDIYLVWVTAPSAEYVPSGRERLY